LLPESTNQKLLAHCCRIHSPVVTNRFFVKILVNNYCCVKLINVTTQKDVPVFLSLAVELRIDEKFCIFGGYWAFFTKYIEPLQPRYNRVAFHECGGVNGIQPLPLQDFFYK